MKVVKPRNKLSRDFPCLETLKAMFDGALSKLVSIGTGWLLKVPSSQNNLWFCDLLLCTDHRSCILSFPCSGPRISDLCYMGTVPYPDICTSLVDTSVVSTCCRLIKQRSPSAHSPCVLELMVVFFLKVVHLSSNIWTVPALYLYCHENWFSDQFF